MVLLTEIYKNPLESHQKPNSSKEFLVEYKKVEKVIEEQVAESIKNNYDPKNYSPNLSFIGMKSSKDRSVLDYLERINVAYYWSDYESKVGSELNTDDQTIAKYNQLTRSPIEDMRQDQKDNYLMYFCFEYSPAEITLIERLRPANRNLPFDLVDFLKRRSLSIVDSYISEKKLYLPESQTIIIKKHPEATEAQAKELAKWSREVNSMVPEQTSFGTSVVERHILMY